uniref:Uncharacterized protein n=1 Tax=Noccaea caerulescens TaxID=107243 RepID=A0A1J3G9D3_NOCCA
MLLFSNPHNIYQTNHKPTMYSVSLLLSFLLHLRKTCVRGQPPLPCRITHTILLNQLFTSSSSSSSSLLLDFCFLFLTVGLHLARKVLAFFSAFSVRFLTAFFVTNKDASGTIFAAGIEQSDSDIREKLRRRKRMQSW